MRRVPPPRSGVRRASPAPSFGRKKQPREALPRGKPHRSRPLAANGAARCAAAPGCAPKSPPSVRGKGRGLDGHALGIRIAPAHAGNACSNRLFLFLDRITPAYAGKKHDAAPGGQREGHHPRIRGEKAPCPRTETCRCGAPPRVRGTVLFCVIPVGMPPHGSPPPVRGKGDRVTFTLSLSGITPAYARKRSVTKPRRTKRTDHPRPCGEKLSTKDFIAPPSGSPPRMRGKVSIDITTISSYRITPAHARKSPQCQTMRSRGQDHPRVCGEKLEPVYQVAAVPGSPPPVRGKAPSALVSMSALRITPACAGKRAFAVAAVVVARDHPRVCGEKLSAFMPVCKAMGSPPRMRGKVPALPGTPARPRITPAHAGKRSSLLAT